MTSLDALFNPRGVAVIGASRTTDKLGAVMAASLSSYSAPLALVNSRSEGQGIVATAIAAAGEILGAGGVPDLAVLCVPATATAVALDECAAAGFRAGLVCAGGFGEAGGSGLDLERAVQHSISRSGLRLLGPNTSGFFAPGSSLFASFVPGVSSLQPGGVAVVASSGGVNHMLSFALAEAGVGIRLAVGIGAGLDVTHVDVLEHLLSDEDTTAVALHIETVSDGARLLRAVGELSAAKPVVALVVGRNDIGDFARSHTGALATSWKTTRALLRQAGAVIVDDEAQLVAAVAALSRGRIRPAPNPGAGLITGQAGPGLLIADALATLNVELPALHDRTRAELSRLLPPITFQSNPVDTGRPGPGFEDVISAVAADESIDVVAVYGISEPVVDLPAAVNRSGATAIIPILIGMDGPSADVGHAMASAAASGICLVKGPTTLAHATAAVAADARARFLRGGEPMSATGKTSRREAWDEGQAKDLLDSLGIRTPSRRVARTLTEAGLALAELGAPVALKILDAAIAHKTEIGGVHLNIHTESQLESAWQDLAAIGAQAVLVEQMAPPGVDLVVGSRRDPVFGPVVLAGLGGTTAEASGDVSIRSIPVTERSAIAMTDDLQSAPLLRGWRGGPTLNEADLAQVVSILGALVADNPWISDVEINPLRVTSDGLIALDAVILVDEEENNATPHA